MLMINGIFLVEHHVMCNNRDASKSDGYYGCHVVAYKKPNRKWATAEAH